MDAYGLTLEGKFVVEKMTNKPIFSEDQIGRFIFVESDETYWVGGLNTWLSFGLSNAAVKNNHINWGNDYGQINAKTIPYIDDVYRYINVENVHDALLELAKGTGLSDGSVNDRVIADECIRNYHISWGIEGNNVGAKDIAIESVLRGNTGVTTIGEAINRIEEQCPIIFRKTVQPTAWEAVPAENLYRVMITTVPIDTPYVIVQCYDLTGKFLLPAKIVTDLSNSRIYIYMPQTYSLTVVIVG